jgi:hypothetical protein
MLALSGTTTPLSAFRPLVTSIIGNPRPSDSLPYVDLPSRPAQASQLLRRPRSISPVSIIGIHSIGPDAATTFASIGMCALSTLAMPAPMEWMRLPTPCVPIVRTLMSSGRLPGAPHATAASTMAIASETRDRPSRRFSAPMREAASRPVRGTVSRRTA